MSKIVKVGVSIPTMGYTDPAAYCNRLINFMHLGKLEERGRLENHEVQFQFHLFVQGRLFTPLAREEAAKAVVENDLDYLFMIDDDMICPDTIFEQLYKHDVDIVAPLAFTRNPPHKPVLYHCVEGYDPVEKKDYFINNVIMNYPKETLVECDAVGFGAVLIKRWVLDKIGTKPFMSTCGTGEDILFCYKAKKIGAKTYMDTGCKLGHLGNPICVTEDYVNMYRDANGFDKKNFFDYSSKGEEKAELVMG